jgi:hypothetical protein
MTTPVDIAVDLHGRLAQTELPIEFQLAAYPTLLQYQLANTPPSTDHAPASGATPATDRRKGAELGNADSSALARRLGREQPALEDIYDLSGNPPSLIVSVRKLDTSVSGATSQIALLVTAARQGSGADDWTQTAEIRTVCQEYSRFDSNNFAGTLTAMGEEFAFRGKGVSREVRLTRPGWERVSELLAELGA